MDRSQSAAVQCPGAGGWLVSHTGRGKEDHTQFTADDPLGIYDKKKPSCRYDSQPYCLTADYLVISDCC